MLQERIDDIFPKPSFSTAVVAPYILRSYGAAELLKSLQAGLPSLARSRNCTVVHQASACTGQAALRDHFGSMCVLNVDGCYGSLRNCPPLQVENRLFLFAAPSTKQYWLIPVLSSPNPPACFVLLSSKLSFSQTQSLPQERNGRASTLGSRRGWINVRGGSDGRALPV